MFHAGVSRAIESTTNRTVKVSEESTTIRHIHHDELLEVNLSQPALAIAPLFKKQVSKLLTVDDTVLYR